MMQQNKGMEFIVLSLILLDNTYLLDNNVFQLLFQSINSIYNSMQSKQEKILTDLVKEKCKVTKKK